ncbi:topoisomerase IV [Clostridium sp. 'White wine YQ']|uniref:topoisomerase IV n=1 Tax=Clostridium sp. 'White wine YQ' TaxID=3027474 RepID=UPI002366F4EB|nr:topoisomerase IV [Clostridium sp. 'White wine YQ']MDD7794784.1 topoisomerase IV [Clostridium sp. 'White wine YQ']
MPFEIIILTIIIAALVVSLVIKSRKKTNYKSKDVLNTAHFAAITSEALEDECVQESGITIPIERLLVTTEINEKSLFEITDRTVIARISETIPAAAETAAKTITNKALKNVELYKAVIPSGATLAESRQMEGAVRGIYSGAKGIKGHANLVKVDPTKISKSASVANGVANVMNVGSLVVGQYYMSEINSKLETMAKSIDQISDFQDREFKSRILSLLSRVEEISQFSSEIMENDEQRKIKLTTLENLKGIATELLGQVNITITDISQKSHNPDFKEYQEKVDEFNILVEYQNILVTALEEVSKLTYLLGKGGISSVVCYSLFNRFLDQSVQTRNLLEQWHEKQVKVLNIDLNKNRISKTGVAGFFSAIPAVVDENWKYKELEQGLAQKINTQIKHKPKALNKQEEIYDEDVQIIIKDGKYYFLNEELM